MNHKELSTEQNDQNSYNTTASAPTRDRINRQRRSNKELEWRYGNRVGKVDEQESGATWKRTGGVINGCVEAVGKWWRMRRQW